MITEKADPAADAGSRKAYGFRETPEPLAARMVELLGVQTGDSVLEPSAGRGALLAALDEYAAAAGIEIAVTTVELDQYHCGHLRNLGFRPAQADFFDLSQPFASDLYDRILAHPPFSRDQDVDHIRYMWALLAPGGRIVSIASAAARAGGTAKGKKFRALVREFGRFEDLPADDADDAEMVVTACLVILDKPE